MSGTSQQDMDQKDEAEKEAIRAAAVKELEQLTASLSTDEPENYGRYANAWNEETWEQEFDSHPLFMSKPADDPANLPPLVEAMRQLKYDPDQNTPDELAQKYKKDGNENFRLKKYRWAIDNYTAGIKLKADDNELNSQLFGNRAAAHLRLGNQRSALSDSLESVRLDGKNMKSVIRIAECYFNLKDYRSCVEYCERHVSSGTSSSSSDHPLQSYLLQARQELQAAEVEAQIKQASGESEARHREKLMQVVVKDRKVDVRGDLFHSHHPASSHRHVELSEEGHLMWPVIFVYPEFSQSDFIEYFDEEATFRQQFTVLFGDGDNHPAWDQEHKYQPNCLKIAFPRFDDPDQLVPVDPDTKLRHVLSSHDYKLVDATPVFVACIKPLEKDAPKERIHVSLTDCLACSGCVTSAETVLIAQQSHEEFLSILSQKEEKRRIASGESNSLEEVVTVVVSLSHQAIASFAVQYGLKFQEAANRLASFLKSLGVDYVFDLTLARHLSLVEAGREFTDTWYNNRSSSDDADGDVGKKLPILSSVCPGWVCYAEKTHGNLVPLLSRVKSPQQVMGSLVKDVWCKRQGIQGKVYHVTIMPCFDKKLEASRSYFMRAETADKDVDSVLTPVEIRQILEERGVSFPEIPLLSDAIDVMHPISRNRVPHDGTDSASGDCNTSSILSHFGSGSGGHAENVLIHAARTLLQRSSLMHSDLHYEIRRNADFLEIRVSAEEKKENNDDDKKSDAATGAGRDLFFAIVNGFRNIQTLVQQLKRGKCPYDFIEIMACPSGCLNGGAQLKPAASAGDAGSDDFSERIRSVYQSLAKINLPLDPSVDPMKELYEDWFPSPEVRDQILYTEFKAVPKTENLLTMTW